VRVHNISPLSAKFNFIFFVPIQALKCDSRIVRDGCTNAYIWAFTKTGGM